MLQAEGDLGRVAAVGVQLDGVRVHGLRGAGGPAQRVERHQGDQRQVQSAGRPHGPPAHLLGAGQQPGDEQGGDGVPHEHVPGEDEHEVHGALDEEERRPARIAAGPGVPAAGGGVVLDGQAHPEQDRQQGQELAVGEEAEHALGEVRDRGVRERVRRLQRALQHPPLRAGRGEDPDVGHERAEDGGAAQDVQEREPGGLLSRRGEQGFGHDPSLPGHGPPYVLRVDEGAVHLSMQPGAGGSHPASRPGPGPHPGPGTACTPIVSILCACLPPPLP